MKKTNVLLVAYSGYPEENSTWLHLDNGLAQLAGTLIRSGHSVKIKDLQTLDTWERLYPYELFERRETLRKEFDQTLLNHSKQDVEGSELLSKIRLIDEEIVERNEKVVKSIAGEVISEFNHFSPDVIGFKLWGQNSLQDQIMLASELRQAFPNALFVGGGPGAELLGEAILRSTSVFDCLVYGPGETAFTKLADLKSSGCTDLSLVPSLIYKRNGLLVRTKRADPSLTEAALPNYRRDVYVDYDKKLHNIHIESDRGCNFKCKFCIHPHKSGRQQKKPAEQFVDELKYLNEEYGFSYFHLGGSDPSFRHMQEISKEVVGRELDFGFMGFQSLRVVDEEGLSWLSKANFDRVWVGIESGDEQVTTDLIKGRTQTRLWKLAELVRKHGIAITGSIITPCPGEGEVSLNSNVATLDAVKPDVTLIYPPLVQPKSPWFNGADPTIQLSDPDKVEDLYVEHGSEWHSGNRVLPPAFFSPELNESIKIEGLPYADIYAKHIVISKEIIKRATNRLSVKQFGDRSRHKSKLKRLYFRSQVSVCNAIRTGHFEKAYDHVKEYNSFVERGGYSVN